MLFFSRYQQIRECFLLAQNKRENDYHFFSFVSREIFIYKHNCHMIPFVLYTDGEDKDRREWKKILKSK